MALYEKRSEYLIYNFFVNCSCKDKTHSVIHRLIGMFNSNQMIS